MTQRLEREATGPAPEQYETETQEPEMEPSTEVQPSAEMQPSAAQGSAGKETGLSESAVEQPAAAEEVEREEPSLAEESSSQEFFDRDQGASPGQDRRDSRIFRARRFLRRRE